MDRLLRSFSYLYLTAALVGALIASSPRLANSQEASPPASDDAGPVFGVAPQGQADLSPFKFEIAAGRSAKATMAVSNEGTETVSLRTFAADIVTAINGGYQVVAEGTSAPEEAAWISLSPEPYAVEPGETRMLDITVTVPEGIPPGEYMAAIATVTTDATAANEADLFQIASRKVNAVVITVPGEINAGFEVGQPVIELTDQSTNVIVPITNTGNVRVKPAGSIVISTSAGEPVAEIPVAMGSVYAWDETTVVVSLSPALADSQYRVSVALSDLTTGATASLPETIVTPRQVSIPG